MATSMNPVELYHDPALDGLITDRNNIIRNGSNRRKSNGQDRRPIEMDANLPMRMPPAPEVPVGPPISYRGPIQGDPNLQRSFSQRAKGRPFAKEAFADQEDYRAEKRAPARQAVYDTDHQNQREVARTEEQPSTDLHLGTRNMNGTSSKRSRPRDITPIDRVAPAPAPAARQIRGHEHSRRTSDSAPYSQQPVSAVSRPNALRDGTIYNDEQRRDWAPDRSPLQKLEVTLNDISKEEKRARVQEAEMLLRESKANRASGAAPVTKERTRSAKSTSTPKKPASRQEAEVVTESPTIEDAGLVRNLSNTQRHRFQHSTTVDSHRPDARRLSGEGRSGFDYSKTQPPEEDYFPGVPSSRIASEGNSSRHSGMSRTSGSRSRPREEQTRVQRSLSAREPEPVRAVAAAVPSNITRAVSMQQHEPPPKFPDDNEYRAPELAERERNASHKATLAKLTGAAAPAAVARSGSRKLQKAPPQDYERNQNRQQDQPASYAQAENSVDNRRVPGKDGNLNTPDAQSAQPQRNLTPVGLGVQAASHTSSPLSPQNQMEVTRQRQRKSSVSFKEPVKRRPVDEWKEAGIARLGLADFVMDKSKDGEHDKAWWEQNSGQSGRRKSRATSGPKSGVSNANPIDDQTTEFNPKLYLRCGPLLRYTGMRRTTGASGGKGVDTEFWRGSVMIVTQDSHSSYQTPPTLRLFSRPMSLIPPPPAELNGEELAPEYVDPLAGLTKVSRIGRPLYVRPVDHLDEEKDLSQLESDDGLFESSPSPLDVGNGKNATTAATNKRTSGQDGEHAGCYQEVLGARLYADPDRDVTFWRFNIEVQLGDEQQHIAYRINRGAATGFWVPARGQTMNIMFHSCNGFSMSVNPHQFSGPDPLWRDVLNVHQTRPFHVMLGGGDQVYNDRVSVETQHFGEWTRVRNPAHKHHAPFTPEMKEELETFYLNRYAMWFSQGLFGMANSQIPMVNVWDDHDIIDGYGSYPDHFMKSPVFSGIGNVAFKYYMLFQHQSVPEETQAHEPSWILGHEPGPYITQVSRSVFMHLGKHVAFVGIDCRTERMRDEILSIRTLDNILERCRKEIIEGETKHLIVLLGIPIAYPRLVWLENVLTSKAMDPIKALGRVGVLKGGFLNKFDGGVEILDDLDDHWTASHHKSERNDLIKDLQDLAAEKSVRITILGGDVHLAAIGQFYSNPKLKIPKDRDHRYMPNIISSAIVNTPPPDMMADIMNKRNKVHHLDRYTDENMIPMFTHDVDYKKRNNRHMLPRRNWCSIREYIPGSTPPPTPPETPSMVASEDEDDESHQPAPKRRLSFTKQDVNPRALFRRLSSRNAPPSSYRDTMEYENNEPLRPASFDGVQPLRAPPISRDGKNPGSRRQSLDSQQGPNRRASSLDHVASGAAVRPGLLRRPTNLSEKAAKKGNVPAVDAEGNEFDVNDHINLDGGLDIVLNVEVNQKDPAGITSPYRLLVPALWYDGSSDREKLDEASGVQRKPTILNRFGVGGRKNHKAAQNQAAGNWGQPMSDTESYTESEDGQKQAPKRRFSLFGNRRQKKNEQWSDSESEQETQDSRPAFAQPPQQQVQQQTQQQLQPPLRNQAAQPLQQQVRQRFQPPLNSGNAQPQPGLPYETPQQKPGPSGHDRLYDTSNPPPQQQQPMSQQAPVRRSLTINSQQPRNTSRPANENYPISQPANSTSGPMRSSAYERQAAFNSPPTPTALPQVTPQQQSPFQPQPQPQQQRRLSKQERILGIGSGIDSGHENDHLQQPGLRGNGIIGKNYDPNTFSHSPGHQAPTSQGYSGIEAYSEPKPRRTFSLKTARDWLDGRN